MSTVLGKDVRSISAGSGITKSGNDDTPTIALNLPDIITAGTTGSGTAVPVITVDAKGRITTITTATASASSAATLTTARTIGGVSFDGSANIDLPGVNTAGNQNTTGSAATLTTARTIGGVSFNGSANIDLPGVNTAGNQNTTGSAATLTTARTIGGVSFDGSANINLPGVNSAGNQDTTGNAATATALATARTISGVSFDGTANITVPKGGRVSLIQDGTLAVTTGTARWYAHASITITNITARVDTAPAGSSLNIALKKVSSGSTTTTNVVIAADATKQEDASPSLTLVEDDYLTVDITQVGSGTAGANLVLTLMYTY